MDIKTSKTIKNLEIKANKNNIIAKFQLFQYLKNGKFTEKNEVLADEYFSQVNDASKDFNFRFDELQLFNFRRFENLTLKTSTSNLTVIIGNNGSGKTSLLEAIAKSLSWFVNNVIREDTTGQKLVPNDITENDDATFATIKSKIKFFDKNNCSVELTRPKASNEEGLQGDYASIKLLADIYRYLNAHNEQFNFPMLAYYPVERTQNQSQIQPNKIEKISSENWSSIDGYDSSLSSHQNFNRFLGWYKRLSFIDISTNVDSNQIKREIQSKTNIIVALKSAITIENKTSSKIQGLIEKLVSDKIKLQKKLKPIQKTTNKLLKFIDEAIIKFIPDITNIKYEVFPEDGFFVEKSGIKLEAKQLSQGERTLIALVGDIARRMIFLNPSLPNPLHGNGIVLIDEVELHIHPMWQQNILVNLTSTFPNIQFIVTTHSPQVLSTVDVNSIRKLDSENNTVSIPKYQTKGVTSADILSQIMETNSIPDVEEARDLNKLIALIQQNQYDSQDAIALFRKLQSHFGESHPEMMYCENQIKLQKLKEKAKEKFKSK